MGRQGGVPRRRVDWHDNKQQQEAGYAMTIIRGTVCATALIVTIMGQQAWATKDFRDVPFLVAKVSEVLESVPTDTIVEWSNPETSSSGTILVTRTYFLGDGSPCREYARTTRQPGSSPMEEFGTGCRDEYGHWTLNEGSPAGRGPEPLLPPTASSSSPTVVESELPAPIILVSPSVPPAVTTPRDFAHIEPTPTPEPARAATPSSEPRASKKTTILSTTLPSRSD